MLSETLRDGILKFALNGGNIAAPPCKQQPRFNLGGTLTQFPQLKANVKGVQGRAPSRGAVRPRVSLSALMGRLPRILGAAMGTAARRPLAVGLLVTVLALAGAALALRLSPTTASKTLVGSSSASYQATEREHQLFGEDAVYVLVRGAVSKLVLTSDLERLIALEGCLGGNVPKGATPVGGWAGPCGRLGKSKPVKVVFGPGTFINESVRQIGDQYNGQLAGDQGRRPEAVQRGLPAGAGQGLLEGEVQGAGRAGAAARADTSRCSDALKLALKYGLLKAPQVNDPGFVSQLVFAGGKAAGTPKARFAYLFPNANSSLIQVRLKPGLSDARAQGRDRPDPRRDRHAADCSCSAAGATS